MPETTNGPRLTRESRPNPKNQTTLKSTAPTPYCRCPRQGDLWLCAGRPALTNHPDGSRCALGATIRLTGRDIDPREELARALEGEGSRE